jgi:hypothetical protein
MGTIVKYLQLPVEQKVLLLKSVVAVCAARIGLKSIRFQTLLKILGIIQHYSKQRGSSDSAALKVESIAWSIAAASRFIPHASCLTQALAAHAMLLREGIPSGLNFGVAKTEAGAFEAHAWLESQGRIVTGNSHDLERYALLLPGQGSYGSSNFLDFLEKLSSFKPGAMHSRLKS